MDPFETTFCGFAVVRNPLHDVESALVKVIIDQLSEQRTKEYKEKTKEPLTFKLDLSGFEPEKIKLKTVGLKLIVEAGTEKSNDKEGCQSYSVKKYHQTITLPDDVKPEDVTSSLTNEGVLRIAALATSLPSSEQEREIKMTMEDEPLAQTSKDKDAPNVQKKVKD